MTKKRFCAVMALLFAAVVALTCALTLAACVKNNKNKHDTSGMYGYGEEGTYYSVDLGTEYILVLDEGKYSLSMGGADSEGTYSYDTSSGAITFTGTDGEIFTGTFAEGNINLSTADGTYLFQPKTTATVTFMMNGSEYFTQDVKIGTTATAIESPAVPDGYAFGGWYTDPECTAKYSFGTAVTGNVTLYAKLIEIDPSREVYEVTFVNGDDVTYGETVNGVILLPEGDVLGWWVCWDGDPSMPMYVYEEDTEVTGDTTLVAVAEGSMGASVYDDKITVKANVVSWNVVITSSDGSTVGYFDSKSQSYSYDFSSLPCGIYTVDVSAPGFDSEKLVYVSGALEKVSVIYAEGDYLIFRMVENATSYSVEVTYGNTLTQAKINAEEGSGGYLAINISDYTMPKDGISFTITAEADGYISSTSKTFLLVRELRNVENLTIVEAKDEATWTAVENATAYEVTISVSGGATTTATTAETGYSFKYYGKGDEIHVTVKPVASGYYSDDSSASASYVKATIAAPSNLTLTGNMISWDAVTDAVSYTVNINGEEISVGSATELELSDGMYTLLDSNEISVRAVAGNEAESSQWSDVLVVAGGESANTIVTYLGDGIVTWNYILGVSDYTVTVTDSSGESAGEAQTSGDNTAKVTFSSSGDITVTVSWGEGKSASVTVTVYSVSFSSTGGDSYSPIYVAQGDKLTLPDAVYGTSSDYTFGGWYTAQFAGTIDDGEYVGDGYEVKTGDTFTWSQNITLYAFWPSVRFTVTFVINQIYDMSDQSNHSNPGANWKTVTGDYGILTDESGNTITSVTVAKGSTTYVLPTPESTDAAYVFVGWFSDLTLTYGYYWEGYNPNLQSEGNGVSTYAEEEGYRYTDLNGGAKKAVTSDMTLYAKWIQVLDFEVSSVTYDGAPVLSVTAYNKSESLHYDTGIADEGNFVDTNMLVWYGVTEITVPDTYTVDGVEYVVGYVGSGAFAECAALEIINLPDTIRYISLSGDGYSEGNGAFAGDGNLKEVNVYETAHHTAGSSEGTLLFSDEGVLYQYSDSKGYLELVYYPQGKSGDYKIPSELSNSGDIDTSGNVRIRNVGGIGTNVFTGKAVGTLIIAESVVNIATKAFSGSGVGKISFLEGTAGTLTIGDYAFENSESLTAINLPVQLSGFNVSFFAGCSNLATVTTTMQGYSVSQDGVLYKDGGATLVYYPIGMTFTDGTYTIPSTVTTIGAGAFANTKITTMAIPSSVTLIEAYAFYGCASLTTLAFGGTNNSNALTIKTMAFYGCTDLASSGDSNHEEYLVLPANLTTMEKYAFGGCTEITRVYYDSINGNVNFENFAFSTEGATSANSSITEVVLGANVPEIAIKSVFGGSSLKTVTIETKEDGTNDYYYTDTSTGAIYGKYSKNLLFVPTNISGAFTFAEGYEPTVIYADTFKDTKITSIVIPATVVEIESGAFYGCSSLKTVTFAAPTDAASNHTLSIGDYAFYGCSALETTELPGYVAYLGTGVFDKCTALKSVTISGYNDGENNGYYGVTSGILYEFAGSGSSLSATRIVVNPAKNEATVYEIYATISGLDSSVFSAAVAEEITFVGTASSSFYIEERMFAGNTTLKKIVLPEGYTSIAAGMFEGATALTEVVIPSTVTEIYSAVFKNATALTTVTFAGVEEGTRTERLMFINDGEENGAAENGAFAYTSSLKTINLPADTTLVDYTFAYSGLTSITVPTGSSEISQYAFYRSSSLETVIIPEGITSIGTQAFAYCTGIKYLTIPASLTNINFSDAFYQCDVAYYFTVADGNTTYKAVDGVLYAINSSGTITEMLYWSKVTTKATLDSVVKTVDANFFGNSAIEELTFSSAVAFSGVTAATSPFSNCKFLKTVTFAEGQTIPDYLFANTTIETIVLPSNVSALGTSVFEGCENLTSVEFTCSGDVTIGDGAFKGCKSLTELKLASGSVISSIGSYAFYGTAVTTFVGADATTIGEYAFAHSGVTSVTLAAGLGTIAASVFEECDSLESVSIPGGVTTVGSRAFYGCDKLEAVTLAEGVSKIGDFAFCNCVSLSSIVIPLSVTSICEYAFYNCAKLVTVSFGENCAEGTSVLNSIGGYAFANTGLTSFSFPDTETAGESVEITLGEEIFGGLDLTELYISLSVKEDSTALRSALRNCTVAHFTVAEGHTVYHTDSDGTHLYDAGENEIKGPVKTGTVTIDSDVEEYAYQNEYISGITISGDVTIGAHAFENCERLETVTIADGVTVTLGDYAFYGCTALTSIDLSCVTSVGGYAFAGCTSLADVTFAAGNLLGDYVFEGDISLTSADISGITTLSGRYVFSGSGLATVTWGERNSVPEYFFAGASSLEMLVTDSTNNANASEIITTLNEGSFYGCSSLSSFSLNSSITSIPAYAFYDCGELSLDISSVKQLNEYSLAGCGIAESSTTNQITSLAEGCFANSNLKTFTSSSSIRSLPAYVFYNSELSDFTGSSNSTQYVINEYAFAYCKNLKSFDFGALYSSGPSSNGAMMMIGDYAFAYSGIEEFEYNLARNNNTTSVMWGSYVFAYCENLTAVYDGAGEGRYSSYAGSIFPFMFAGCTNLETIEIKNAAICIYEGAFQNCINVESITLGSNIKLVGDNTKTSCDSSYTFGVGIFDGWGTGEIFQTITVNCTSKDSGWNKGVGTNATQI